MRKFWTLILLLFSMVGEVARAQAGRPATAAPARRAPSFSFSISAGLAQHSPVGPFGHTPGRDVAMFALRASRVAFERRTFALDYAVEVIPALWVSMPLSAAAPAPCMGICPVAAFAGQRAVYGAGILPLGTQLRMRPAARLQPFAGLAVGSVRFGEQIPVGGASRFNFIAEAGAGLRIARPGGWGLALGYQFQHISNGGTASENPGLDGHLLYMSILRAAASPPPPAA